MDLFKKSARQRPPRWYRPQIQGFHKPYLYVYIKYNQVVKVDVKQFSAWFPQKAPKRYTSFSILFGSQGIEVDAGVLDSWLVVIWLVASGLTVASDGFGWEPKLQNESLQVFAGGHCCWGLLPNPCRPPTSCNTGEKENKRYH